MVKSDLDFGGILGSNTNRMLTVVGDFFPGQ